MSKSYRYRVILSNGPERVTETVDVRDREHPVQNNIAAIEAARQARPGLGPEWRTEKVERIGDAYEGA